MIQQLKLAYFPTWLIIAILVITVHGNVTEEDFEKITTKEAAEMVNASITK